MLFSSAYSILLFIGLFIPAISVFIFMISSLFLWILYIYILLPEDIKCIYSEVWSYSTNALSLSLSKVFVTYFYFEIFSKFQKSYKDSAKNL